MNPNNNKNNKHSHQHTRAALLWLLLAVALPAVSAMPSGGWWSSRGWGHHRHRSDEK